MNATDGFIELFKTEKFPIQNPSTEGSRTPTEKQATRSVPQESLKSQIQNRISVTYRSYRSKDCVSMLNALSPQQPIPEVAEFALRRFVPRG